MTRVREEVTPSNEVEITQDYSPGYDISLGVSKVIEGTRIMGGNANASTGSANLIDIDVNNIEIVDSLNDRYPLAWPSMYPGTTYSFRDVDGKSQALKLVKAVELWLYLNNFESSNLEYDAIEDNLSPSNIEPASTNGLSYSDYLDKNDNPYRIPPETMWNREIFYDQSGNRIDADGNVIPTIYVDSNGSPVFRNYDLGTDEELNVLKLSLEVASFRGKLPQNMVQFVNPDHTLVKDIHDFTPSELQSVRDAELLFSPISIILPYSPFTLHGTRVIATKVAGSHVAKLYSTDYMSGTEYESTLRAPKTEYEWGGAYASGKNTY